MPLNNQSLAHHFLEESAQNLPQKTALIHEGVRATYGQINRWANQLAHWLIGQGIQHGDRVILLLENGLEYVITYYAALKAGAVAVPVSSDTKSAGLRHFLQELEPRVVVSSTRFERLLKATASVPTTVQALVLKDPSQKWSSASFSVFLWEDLVQGQNPECSNPGIHMEESALASIVYTSGSTGKPKGVMLSHGNIVSNTHSICRYLNLTDKDLQLAVLPFF